MTLPVDFAELALLQPQARPIHVVEVCQVDVGVDDRPIPEVVHVPYLYGTANIDGGE